MLKKDYNRQILTRTAEFMSLAQVQQLAADVFIEVENGKNLSDTLAAVLSRHSELSAQDKGMLQDIAYGVQRYRGSLNFMLVQMLNKPPQQPRLRALLLAAMYQLQHTRNAPHAVVNEAVRHSARLDGGRYRALSNAVLRRFQREMPRFQAACAADRTAKYNLPEWFARRLQNDYPQHWHNIAAAFQTRPPLTLRINRRRSDAATYLALLQQHGLNGKILDDYALMLDEAVPVAKLPGFADGMVSVQDFGAQQAVPMLAVRDGERVLDACAAPGGKSGHILESADCELTALDIDAARLQRVDDNLSRLGFQAALHCAAAQDLNHWYNGCPFDAVLADVPCTASGTVKRNPDIKWLRRPQDAAKTAAQQEVLLDALWTVLKNGGRMLLATCSLFEEENAAQCRRFLERHADARLQAERLLLPNLKQDGFYYALLEKR
ncbi:MAG: 16S rRNA (cytosine(967)-C(5))-methyltransferase RsmB [Conchiformibius sp.]|nr:16S rRNA (cytosine(967)-C(5))-methyltransferase RsmB [Conchiformibius sp.]